MCQCFYVERLRNKKILYLVSCALYLVSYYRLFLMYVLDVEGILLPMAVGPHKYRKKENGVIFRYISQIPMQQHVHRFVW